MVYGFIMALKKAIFIRYILKSFKYRNISAV